MLILANEEIETLLGMDECIAALEEAYLDFARGRALNSFRGENLAPCGRDDAHYLFKHMGGTWPARGIHALRINSDIISYSEVGGLPRRVKQPMAGGRWVGLVQLYSLKTGELLAIFPDGVAQRMRVAACSGIAAKSLARADASRLGLIGCGWQAGAQLMAALAVRPITEVKVYSLRKESRESFAREMGERLGIRIRAVATAEECARDVDIIAASTSSMVPVVEPAWLLPGMHVSCIRTEELDERVLARCDRVAVHVKDDQQMEPMIVPGTPGVASHMGNFAAQHGQWQDVSSRWAAFPELSDLVAAKASGRADSAQITCFINNVGLGLQFAAMGALILEKARVAGVGRELPREWFTENVHP